MERERRGSALPEIMSSEIWTLYHLMQPHSHHAEQFWHGLDLLGIIIVTVGTFSSGIYYYMFFCEASLQELHWAIVSPSDK